MKEGIFEVKSVIDSMMQIQKEENNVKSNLNFDRKLEIDSNLNRIKTTTEEQYQNTSGFRFPDYTLNELSVLFVLFYDDSKLCVCSDWNVGI